MTLVTNRLFHDVVGCIGEIDQECRTLLCGTEHGLINVKLEFQNRAQQELGKRLTEETLIAWLLSERLRTRAWTVEWEAMYPGNRRKKADLAVHIGSDRWLWLELK
jgi:hypothetical protein